MNKKLLPKIKTNYTINKTEFADEMNFAIVAYPKLNNEYTAFEFEYWETGNNYTKLEIWFDYFISNEDPEYAMFAPPIAACSLAIVIGSFFGCCCSCCYQKSSRH
jgi:hypothetical protein